MHPGVIGDAQSAPVISWVPDRAESHLSDGDGLVVLEHDLRYDLRTAVVHQLVGLGEIPSREPVSNDWIEIHQSVVNQAQNLAPDCGCVGEGPNNAGILRNKVVGRDFQPARPRPRFPEHPPFRRFAQC